MSHVTKLLALAALVGVSSVPASASESRPAVRLLDDRPVTVAGRGFVPGERVGVRVVPVGRQPFAKFATAGVKGGFRVVFPARTLDECDGYAITALGNRGSRATAQERVPPPCGIVVQP